MQCNRRGRRHWILRDMMPQGVPRKLNSWQPERFFLFIFFFLIRSAYWSECLTQNNKKNSFGERHHRKRPQYLWRLLGLGLNRKRRFSLPLSHPHTSGTTNWNFSLEKKNSLLFSTVGLVGFYYMLWFMQFQFIITSSSLKGYNNML